MLRRLPWLVRELRWRQGPHTGLHVRDRHDLEDVLRAVLALHGKEWRLEGRTPHYALGHCTDFIVVPRRLVIVAKYVVSADQDFEGEWREDRAYYVGHRLVRSLLGVVYDPLGQLPGPDMLERAWSCQDEEPSVRCLIVR